MSKVIIPWNEQSKKDKIIKEIEERSQKHDAFSLSIDVSMLEWLEDAIDNGVVKRAYTGSGDKVDVVIGIDEPSAQMLVDRMR
jgi:hypothetical protein